jgi:hypothetical protein
MSQRLAQAAALHARDYQRNRCPVLAFNALVFCKKNNLLHDSFPMRDEPKNKGLPFRVLVRNQSSRPYEGRRCPTVGSGDRGSQRETRACQCTARCAGSRRPWRTWRSAS